MPRTHPPALPIVALSVALAVLAGQARAEDRDDADRGKVIFRTTGGCVNCHGWAADGKTGVNMRAPSGPSLRETALDGPALTEVIRCGRPGTPMPPWRSMLRDGEARWIAERLVAGFPEESR